MKFRHLLSLTLLIGITISLTVNAHDPAEHTEKAEAPKCEAMDTKGMAKNDPVLQAMLKKCMAEQKNAGMHNPGDLKQGNSDDNHHSEPHENGEDVTHQHDH